jgi:WS/DGAT/MGAT family acyltransferase
VTGTHERLSAQDQSFLLFEHDTTPMHVSAVAIFASGGPIREGGGLDVERMAKSLESRLHLLPRYRQRLATTPLERNPIWVDDPNFDLAYHMRHTSLPKPGTDAQLKALSSRILSAPLDRERPLWEMWAVEGLENGGFALISKIHHCMVDGATGMNIMTVLFSPEPDEETPAVPGWTPSETPSPVELVVEDGLRRLRLPFDVLRNAVSALRDPRAALASLGQRGQAIVQAIESGLHLSAPTPINAPVGTHRRIDWHSLELERVKQVKNALGVTVNDVILAVAAGALRRFLRRRGVDVDELDFRVVVPVNMRAPDDDLSAANHVSALLFSLPIDEAEPLDRIARVHEETSRLKRSDAALGTDLLMQSPTCRARSSRSTCSVRACSPCTRSCRSSRTRVSASR